MLGTCVCDSWCIDRKAADGFQADQARQGGVSQIIAFQAKLGELGQAPEAADLARRALDSRMPSSQREELALSADGREYVQQNTGAAAFQLVRSLWVLQGAKSVLVELRVTG